jgi:hypothetical protein
VHVGCVVSLVVRHCSYSQCYAPPQSSGGRLSHELAADANGATATTADTPRHCALAAAFTGVSWGRFDDVQDAPFPQLPGPPGIATSSSAFLVWLMLSMAILCMSA